MPQSFRTEWIDDPHADMLGSLIRPVLNAFASATYYDNESNERNCDTEEVLVEATAESREHSKGKRDPATNDPLSSDDQEVISKLSEEMDSSIMYHTNKEIIEKHRIPDNFETFSAPDLRGIISYWDFKVVHNEPEI